jgi:cysteine desulfurase/selenocysteine lyase
VSILRAFEYVESIGGYQTLEEIEHELVEYTLEKFAQLSDVKIIGSTSSRNRVGVFTFVIPGIHSHDIAEYLAENNICVRAGQHCAEPFMDYV